MQFLPFGMPRRPLVRAALAFCAALFVTATVQAQVAPAQIQPSAMQQMSVLRSIKANKSSVQHKIDSRIFLGLLHARRDTRLAALPDFRFVRPDADGAIAVQILVSDASGMKRVLNQLERVRADVTARSYAHPQVLARVPLLALEELAALPEVRRVRQPLPRMTNAINTSEGDLTHGVQQARAFFGVSGAGVKICAISDGVDALAALIASDDLPATIDVLPGQAGVGNEGTAMLEIIHDLAPNAELGFATADPTPTQFAQNIIDLAAAGCDIIVDDIIYLSESPFQDGIVAQAVNTVTAAGVLYFSSAGNEGNNDDNTSGTWEGDFLSSGAADPAPLAGANLHNFGDGGNSLLVTSGDAETPSLMIWAEHFDELGGTASTDFDLYDMDGGLTTIFDASTDVQDGVGGDDFALEYIAGGTFGGERLLVDRFAAGTTSSVPMFNLIVFRGEVDDALSTSGTTRGHSAAADAYSVAATPVGASFDGVTPDGPFPGLFTASNASEGFSADGPRRILLSPTGAELTPGNRTSTGGVVRQKPDFTAADGVSTASPGFATFYGTSAAAPHAAAIAGLIKSGVAGVTPAQVRTALVSTALDIEAPGVDRSTGAGIVMAQAALAAAGAVPGAYLDDSAPLPTQIVGDGDAFIEPNEDWSLAIALQNIGGAGATAISATLSTTTPGIVITRATSTYADLAVAASAPNDMPYTFYVQPGAVCGGNIEFVLDVTYAGGSVGSASFTYALGTGGLGAPVTLTYGGAPVAIPDGLDGSGSAPGAVAETVIAAAGLGALGRVSMRIDGATCDATEGSTTVGIDHAFVGDLEITLLSPAGTPVLAIHHAGDNGNNLCQTELDDFSAGPGIQSVASSDAPFTGSFTPASAFSVLDGENGDGNWTLRVQDFFQGDTGTIRAWSVTLAPAVCDAPVQAIALSATKTVSGDFVEGGNIVYTVTVTNTGNGLQHDNAGAELTDTLPAGLVLGLPAATAGTVSAGGVDPVTWNGALLPGASVTITIPATIETGTAGLVLANQAVVNFDGSRSGANNNSALSNDPGTGAANDPTLFTVLQGQLSITPAALAFGNVAVGDTAAAQDVTLENTGGDALTVTAIVAPAAPFAAAGTGTCPATPFVLVPTQSCTLAYNVTPVIAGAANASVGVTADVPGSGNIALSATGVTGTLGVTPASVDFGDIPVGTISGGAAVTLQNTGAAALQVTAIETPPADFAVVGGDCPAAPFTLAPAAGCVVIYTFNPTSAGAINVMLDITDNSGGTSSVTLLGTGTQAQLVVAPAALAFGNVAVDAGSAPLSFTVSNPGNRALQINGIIGEAAPFARSGGTCAAGAFALAAGGSCTAQYTFSPTAAGDFNATVQVIAADGAIPSLDVSLTGSALAGDVQLSPALLNLGNVPVGETGPQYEQGVQISNAGNVGVTITSFGTVPAPFYYAGSTCPALPFVLAPGGFCIIGYGVSPTAEGAVTQTFSIVTDDGELELTLQANGIATGAPPAVSQPLNIPVMSNLGLLLAVALLALAGVVGMRRQS